MNQPTTEYRLNICFVMYPWERIQAESDSTIRLIHECVARNHRVAVLSPNNMTIRNSITYGFCKILQPHPKSLGRMQSFHSKMEFKEQLLPLAGFDAIIIRDNPPLDPTLLNFLDSVQDETFILNGVNGLRKANNKLYPAVFDESVIPETHVSKNKEYLKRVVREHSQERMILKPFNGYGGSGVIVLEKSAKENINSLLDFYIDGTGSGSNYVILQEFLDEAAQGDVRVLVLNGEPIGAMRRVPADGEIRSNIHAGGTAVKHQLTKEERLLIKKVAPRLVADNLFFVGLDIIQGKLIEVNVLSPGGISRINKLNRTKLEKKVIDFVESRIDDKTHRRHMKLKLRYEVENA